MKIKFTFLIILFISTALVINSCKSFFGKKNQLKFDKVYVVDTTGFNYMFVTNSNGNVKVYTAPSDSVIRIRVFGILDSKPKDSLDFPSFYRFDTVSSTINISEPVWEKKMFSFSFKKNEVNFEISIPSPLKLHIDNKNGNIEVENFAGSITAQTINGSIQITGISGATFARTTNGKIQAEIDSITTCTFTTVNGKIELALSSHFSGKVIASYVNGKVVNKDVVFDKVESDRNRYFGVRGTSNAEVNLETVNGKIYIRQKL
ncbi:MAG: DUF4097 family beta strand repeat-containing protein [Ignavibacteria bacterium]